MKKILINTHPWETRVAIMDGGKLQNAYFTPHAANQLERCFFKGVVTKVLPGIQTAFVDIGQEKAGFLHISEIDYELGFTRMAGDVDDLEEGEKKEAPPRRKDLDMGKIFTEGEAILVQVSKEPVYEKGAKLTTCFTLAGRFIVLMPNVPRIGISKRIGTKEERTRLRDIIKELLPEGMGAIVRTSCEGKTKVELSKDIKFLIGEWRTIEKKFKRAQNEERIFEDLPASLAVIRDNLDDNVESILADSPKELRKITNYVRAIAPEYKGTIELYQGELDLFSKYNVEKQIEDALQRKVYLKSGGSIIVESTEAMTVVDVNTGRFTGKGNKATMEDTILRTNLEAAQEVVRQLRLRNIGGLIVIDFIDMSVAANRQKLFKFFEQQLREQDRFQSVVLKISEFGLVQMTRKRSGKTLVQQLTRTCSCCRGLGFVHSIQTISYGILRRFQATLKRERGAKNIVLSLNPEVFEHITHTGYNTILELEKTFECTITLASDKGVDLASYAVKII